MTHSPTTVSVVMRTKNADWVIGQALRGLFSQDFTAFDLLVADSGSTDTTLDVVGRYPHRLIHIPPKEYFPGRVLNQGVAATEGSIVVFQNSDAVPLSPRSLSALLAPFEDPQVQATFGRQLPRPEADPWVRREVGASFPDGEAPPWITLALPWAAMRRSAWEAHHFYDAAWGSEDTEWGQWARDHGMTIRYVPEALVMHSHNFTYKQLYSRRFIEGEADAFIYRHEHGVRKALFQTLTSVARDVADCVKLGQWLDIPRSPARRVVYSYGYWKGHQLGVSRRASGNVDASEGQATALKGHASNRD